MIFGSVPCQPFAVNLLQEMCVRKGTVCHYIAHPSYSKKIQIADETIHLTQEALQTKYMSVATLKPMVVYQPSMMIPPNRRLRQGRLSKERM